MIYDRRNHFLLYTFSLPSLFFSLSSLGGGKLGLMSGERAAQLVAQMTAGVSLKYCSWFYGLTGTFTSTLCGVRCQTQGSRHDCQESQRIDILEAVNLQIPGRTLAEDRFDGAVVPLACPRPLGSNVCACVCRWAALPPLPFAMCLLSEIAPDFGRCFFRPPRRPGPTKKRPGAQGGRSAPIAAEAAAVPTLSPFGKRLRPAFPTIIGGGAFVQCGRVFALGPLFRFPSLPSIARLLALNRP